MKLYNVCWGFLNGAICSAKNSILTPATLVFFLIMSQSAFTQQPDTLFSLESPFEEIDGLFGTSVSGIGDVNLDGIPDILVGARYEDPGNSPENAGRAYVISGATRDTLFSLKSPFEEANSFFANSVSGVGDVNMDGIPDVIVSAALENPGNSPENAGRAYIFSGATGDTLFSLKSPHEEANGHFGNSVSGAGDVNMDGRADIIVGAQGESPGASPEGAGRAYLFSGATGDTLFSLKSPNEEMNGGFGSVSGAGDVNMDGIPDLIVGAAYEGPGASPDGAGRAYLFSGADGSLLFELMSPNEETFGFFGGSVSGAGDVNLDGRADVIVGAHAENPGNSLLDAGRAYVFSGADGSLLFELASLYEGFQGQFGSSVSSAGDVNWDGVPDVVVGAVNEGPGRVYVFCGASGAILLFLRSPFEQEAGGFGCSVSSAGDMNMDGKADVIIGAFNESPGNSPEGAGRVYVYSGGGSCGGCVAGGLSAYYPFNGNANDASGNGNHGTLLGGAVITDTLILGNNQFDALSLPHTVIDGLTDFTFASWLKIDVLHTGGGRNFWLSGARAGEDNALNISYDNGIGWHLRIDGIVDNVDTAIMEDLDWHHVAITRSGNTGRLYIDGLEIGSGLTVNSSALNVDENGFIVGQDQDNVGGGFQMSQSWAGKMDDLRIYYQALSDVEILALFNNCGPDIAADPPSLDFGNIPVGSDSTRQLVISNVGEQILVVDNIFITGRDAGEFFFTGNTSFTLASMESETLEVVFSPDSEGSKIAALRIESNDPDEDTLTVPLSGGGGCVFESFFTTGDEGWTIAGDGQGPNYFPNGGNPDGYISATDNQSGIIWYFQAPDKFLGNISCAYGGTLSFDLRQSSTTNQMDRNDIVLEGAGLTLVFDTPFNPGTDWTSYSVQLVETAGWKKDNLNGDPPTQAEMIAVLAALEKLWICGEYRNGPDTGDLDNVVLDNTPIVGINDPPYDLIPETYELEQNYPNPFNPVTRIQFALPRPGEVSLVIYNSLGQKVRTLVSEYREAGYHILTWDASNDDGQKVGSGMYFYVVNAGEFWAVKKMILLK